ncbi:MAG: sigma-70 family RNA polymerase sigma factor [Lentisphaeria bacterium]|nr:sigma-70 family RNA polymerase sigma factor [Lentisphaeria bacterium]
MSNENPAAEVPCELSDEQLIATARNGSDHAMELLYERYRKPLYAFVVRMLNGDSMTADDVFQDLWIKVFNKLSVYREDGKFAAWLFRIARNQVLEHFRREKSRAKIGALTSDGDMPETITENGNPSGLVGAQMLGEQLEKLLAELPEEQREVFLMRQNDLSFKEIAEIQKCPINTALGRMHNCLKFLRQRLSL